MPAACRRTCERKSAEQPVLNLGRDDADWREARWLRALVPKLGAFPFRGIMLAIPYVPCSKASPSEPPRVADLDNRWWS